MFFDAQKISGVLTVDAETLQTPIRPFLKYGPLVSCILLTYRNVYVEMKCSKDVEVDTEVEQ